MCDMPTVLVMDDVGVRELRQNLSVYLRRIQQGETLRVTDHGHPVALLTPLRDTGEPVLDRLEAEGRLDQRAPRRTGLLPKPAPRMAGARPLSEILLEEREGDWR
jgi:prevent-host-death family protein